MVSSCSNPAGMTPTRSQLSLHHRLTHTGRCDVEPTVKMSCFAYVGDVITCCLLYCCCNRNSNAGECDVVDLWFRPLSSSGTNDDRSGFVWIQTKTVGVQPAMDGLETVVDNAECLVGAEGDV